MALIYANAVNKRINAPPIRKKSADCARKHSPCSHRSQSREVTPRKKSSSSSTNSFSSLHSSGSGHLCMSFSHRPVQRSKTSTGDLLTKIEEDTIRKVSTPALMSQSITSDTLCAHSVCHCGNKNQDTRRIMARKSLIQKYHLESALSARSIQKQLDSDDEDLLTKEEIKRRQHKHEKHAKDRRRSESAQSWLAEGEDLERPRKTTVFDKMRRKFSSFKI